MCFFIVSPLSYPHEVNHFGDAHSSVFRLKQSGRVQRVVLEFGILQNVWFNIDERIFEAPYFLTNPNPLKPTHRTCSRVELQIYALFHVVQTPPARSGMMLFSSHGPFSKAPPLQEKNMQRRV